MRMNNLIVAVEVSLWIDSVTNENYPTFANVTEAYCKPIQGS